MSDKSFIDKDYQYIRLKYCWDMILCLNDFINCISLHRADLKSLRNIGLMNFMKDFYGNKEFNPAGVLKDYIYLEASSFFEYAKELKLTKGDKIALNETPKAIITIIKNHILKIILDLNLISKNINVNAITNEINIEIKVRLYSCWFKAGEVPIP